MSNGILICPDCHGSGRKHAMHPVCENCKGSGEATQEQKKAHAKAVAEALAAKKEA